MEEAMYVKTRKNPVHNRDFTEARVCISVVFTKILYHEIYQLTQLMRTGS
jgi:hypothetical protein